MYSVESLLAEKKIDFVPSGPDYLVLCLNPEHDDRNPSMRIDQITGVFNCFSCGYSGNIFAEFDAPKDENSILRHKLRESIQKVRGELVGHEIPPKSIPFRDDYRGIDGATYEKFEAFTYGSENEFANRLWLPLRSMQGKVICFLGRDMTESAKAKYKIYPKHTRPPLLPAVPELTNGKLILVEGMFDMLNLYSKGLRNVSACLGTSTVDDEKISILKMLGVQYVDVIFDGDSAGLKGAEELVERLQAVNIPSDYVQLPDDLDPGAMNQEQVDNLRELLYG